MKLKKREITLNEADSLKDIFYLEGWIKGEYEKEDCSAYRKEVQNEREKLVALALEEEKRLKTLLERSLQN